MADSELLSRSGPQPEADYTQKINAVDLTDARKVESRIAFGVSAPLHALDFEPAASVDGTNGT